MCPVANFITLKPSSLQKKIFENKENISLKATVSFVFITGGQKN